jgi:hypothetical protein
MEARKLAIQHLPKEACFEFANIVILLVPYDTRVSKAEFSSTLCFQETSKSNGLADPFLTNIITPEGLR